MEILAHRGLWQTPAEKNSLPAFERALKSGFGIELDVRDHLGQIVIAHDVWAPGAVEILFTDFLALNARLATGTTSPTIAINIKSSELAREFMPLLQGDMLTRYFVFDMSVPDMMGYLRLKANVFTRQSEVEKEPSAYPLAKGVWLDELSEHWIQHAVIASHLQKGKQVAIVSPELHGRPFENVWTEYKNIFRGLGCLSLSPGERVFLCTDHPERASEFFYEKNQGHHF